MPRALVVAPPTERPSPEELHAAAVILARELLVHARHGLAHGRLAALVAVGRQAEHFTALVGPAVAAQAFHIACQEG